MPHQRQLVFHWYSRGALLLVILGMYLPLLVTMVYSFNRSRIGTVWTGFSWDGYKDLWKQKDLWQALVASCLIGTAASTISVAAGTMAAWGLRRWGPRGRALAAGLRELPRVPRDARLA